VIEFTYDLKCEGFWIGKGIFSKNETEKLNNLYNQALNNVDIQVKKLFSSIIDSKNNIVLITSDHDENI